MPRSASISRGVIGALVAVLLAGCGGAQISTVPQTTLTQDRAHQAAGSWMLPEAKSEDLLYVSEAKHLIVYSYPKQAKVGELTGFTWASGLCSDRNGNVWVTDYRASKVTEYAHGGTKPIARLNDGDEPTGCAVDPRTGNLAVVNYVPTSFSIYPHAGGTPTIYGTGRLSESQYCTYDGNGDLFVDGWRGKKSYEAPGFLELPFGGSQIQRFKIRGASQGIHYPGPLQWDGRNLVVGYGGAGNNVLYQVANLGSIGKVARTITLSLPGDSGAISGFYQFWLHKKKIIQPYDTEWPRRHHVGSWPYPTGGSAVKTLTLPLKSLPEGITISVTPPG